MNASTKRTARVLFASILLLPPISFAGEPKGNATTRVVEERSLNIYSNYPIGDSPDRRSEIERYYDPYYFSPASKTAQIVVNPALPSSHVDAAGSGTVLEVSVRWTGPNEFATVGFVPAGARRLGQLPGKDMTQLLGDATGHKAYLKFRARRPAGHPEVKAKFRMGGLAGNPNRDSLKFPIVMKPAELTSLSESWQEYSIDCTANLAQMNAVLCPFSITLESQDNPHARKQDGSTEPVSTLYVDDIRLVAVREEASKK